MPHAHTPDHSGASIAIPRVQPYGDGDLVLTTTATDLDGRLADRHSAYHDNLSPPLIWTQVKGAAAYAIIVEDPDAPRERPFVHWLIWNIPCEATSLPEGLPNEASLGLIGGAVQGRNDSGSARARPWGMGCTTTTSRSSPWPNACRSMRPSPWPTWSTR